jgi:hypothetical protein
MCPSDMDAPALIEATSVSLKTLADGTLRITVEVEPYNALDAFTLFRQPGTVMALAAIQQEKKG